MYAQARGTPVYRGLHCTVHYDPSKSGIAALAVGPRLMATVLEVATVRAMPYAKAISPRSGRSRRREDGEPVLHYQDAFIVEPGTVHDIGHPPMVRAAARLINLSPHAKLVEVGTATSPKYRVLARTLDHLNGANPARQ